jgi:2-dehydro-3-deoxygluconokinase
MTPVATARKQKSSRKAAKPGRRGQAVACFGEILWRIGPQGQGRLLQEQALVAHAGGAEANVAVSLALLGHPSGMLGIVADNPLGAAAATQIRSHGVDTTFLAARPGRMGLYFLEPGAVNRSAQVTYDRADSAFATNALPVAHLRAALGKASWLHISGITPALGPVAKRNFSRVIMAAAKAGIRISFDCNVRPTLWAGRPAEAARAIRLGVRSAELAFADERSLSMALGLSLEGPAAVRDFTSLCRRAFARFPRLQAIARTSREEISATRQLVSAQLATRSRVVQTGIRVVDPVVDRIGSGDAFAAALLAARIERMPDDRALEFALAACCLKLAIAGDFNLASRAQVEANMAGAR